MDLVEDGAALQFMLLYLKKWLHLKNCIEDLLFIPRFIIISVLTDSAEKICKKNLRTLLSSFNKVLKKISGFTNCFSSGVLFSVINRSYKQ